MDCTFKTAKGRFNYRVGAIITSDRGVLVTKNEKENYYYSVGGRVKMNETLDTAIEREVLEETNCKIARKQLAFIHENFFISDMTNESYHEISMYYYVELMDDRVVSCQTTNEFGLKEQLEWLSVNQLSQVDLRPTFLKEQIGKKNETIQHIVQKG